MNITINGAGNWTTNLNTSVSIDFDSFKKVHNEIRGYLVCISNKWVFIGTNQYFQFQNKKSLKKIALVLESPHKDEYDSNYNPLRPANGKTGKKINHKLAARASFWGLKSSSDYQVYLMNPVQYQASCYHEFNMLIYNVTITSKIKVERKNTNQVFRLLFNKNKGNQRKEFINEMENYNPIIIVNCCTSNLKKVVETAINEANTLATIVQDKHPSVW